VVAVIAGMAVAAAAVVPGLHRSSAPSESSPAVTSAPVTADDGTLVTDARRLLGAWQTIELDGKDVSAVRDGGGQPLGVTFLRYGGQLNWGANDLTNYHSGKYSVSGAGVFRANPGAVTEVGTIGNREQYLRNPEAVQEATEARLVAATATGPPQLLLIAHEKIIAVCTPAVPVAGASPTHG
jgi:hypothetical protein